MARWLSQISTTKQKQSNIHYEMLYYNISHVRPSSRRHDDHHHHPPALPIPAALQASILRLSAPQRLGVAALMIVMLWLAAFWAMR